MLEVSESWSLVPGQTLSNESSSLDLMRLLALGIMAALVLPALAGFASGGSEPPTLLATAYNTERKLGRGPDGTLYAAVTVDVGGTPQVRVLSTRDGAAWTVLPPPSATGLSSDRSSLAVDSTGRIHLVWTELNVERGQVFYAAFAGGWSPPEQLSHSPSYAGFPSLAVDAGDRPHIVWYGFDGQFYQIYYRRLDPSGWTAEQALTNENVDATNPAIALGPEGHVHVAWFRQNRNATSNEVAYLRVEGDTVVENRPVSTPGVDSADPSLVVNARGDVHLAWSATVGVEERIVHRERSAAGAWSSVETVSPAGIGGSHPSLALERDGLDLRAVWEGSDGQVRVQGRTQTGWAEPVVLSAGGVNRYPSARWAQDHNPLCPAGIDVVWTREDGGNGSLGHAILPSPGPCPAASSNFPAVGLAALAIVSVGVVIVLVRRRRQKPRRIFRRFGRRRVR